MHRCDHIRVVSNIVFSIFLSLYYLAFSLSLIVIHNNSLGYLPFYISLMLIQVYVNISLYKHVAGNAFLLYKDEIIFYRLF